MGDEKDRYLSLLDFKSGDEAYAQVRKLASGLSDREHLIRSCIFDLHAAVEVELRRVFYHTFYAQLALADDEDANAKNADALAKVIDDLGFMQMFKILGPVLRSWPYPDFKSIQAVADARNQAAHEDVSKVRYKGRNPFEDADCFAQMYSDVWAIRESMKRFFDKTIAQPQRVLRRYIDKYGSDLIF